MDNAVPLTTRVKFLNHEIIYWEFSLQKTKLFDIVEFRHLLKLAIPLLLTQIFTALMLFTDTVIASQLSHVDMASVSVATSLWGPVVFSVQGLLIAVTPVVAQLLGQQKHNENNQTMAATFVQGVYLSLFVCVVVVGFYQFSDIPLKNLDLEPELYEKSVGYLQYVIYGVVPTCLFFVMRSFCEGIGLTKPALITGVIGLIVNIPLNYVFVFGEFGMPQLGGAGCGLATALVQWVSFFALVVYFKVSKQLKPFNFIKAWAKPDFTAIGNLTRIGFPIFVSLIFETTLFAFSALAIAPLGAIAIAGHQVAFSYSSVVFMVPLSLSMAATIRIGYLRGIGDMQMLKQAIKSCFVLAALFGMSVMMITFMFRDIIIALYTSEPEVVALAASILIITAIYQLPDAIQVMCAGIFKGLKITKPLLYITFIAYWPIGFTLGYLLGRTDVIVPAMGPAGFWWGIVFGLTSASVMFFYKLNKTLKNPSF
jgi:multidrug resistance protein, MATE family